MESIRRHPVRSRTLSSVVISALVLGSLCSTAIARADDALADPGNLSSYRDKPIGTRLKFKVTGAATGGSVWGTDAYTLDSKLAVAAVHAGALKAGETGTIDVTIIAGAKAHTGSARHGVTSSNWGAYEKSYEISRIEVLADPGNLTSYQDKPIGTTFRFKVTGATAGGSVWGTDAYTLDSKIAIAAVHAGAIKAGETGTVDVTIIAGAKAHTGSARNGVTSSTWGAYAKSYEFGVGSAKPAASAAKALPDPGNLSSYSDRAIGAAFEFQVKGATSGGSVWGTDYYTLDSKLAIAAVHAGAIKAGEDGVVVVTITEGQKAHTGSARNGVTSSTWGAYAKSYKVEAKVPTIADPGNLSSYRDEPIGTTIRFKVTGATSGGSVWGTDAYTLDSKLAIAAVHAGAIKAGETGTVDVTIITGAKAHTGSARNGVTSSSWGAYEKSYEIRKP